MPGHAWLHKLDQHCLKIVFLSDKVKQIQCWPLTIEGVL